MKPAAREGDAHACDKHGGDKIVEGSSNVTINGKPAARVDDHIVCKTGEKTQIKSGSSSVTINGKSAARQEDPTGHDGKITSGSDNVSIGKSGKPTSIGSKGPVSIGGNGKPVSIGQAEEVVEEILDIANIAMGVGEIIGGIPLDEIGVGEVMQGDGIRRIAKTVGKKALVNMNKQGKHIPSHKNFKPGKSELTHKNPQELVDRFAGKGTPVNKISPGEPGYKERVDFGENIGNYVDPGSNIKIPTNNGIIHYSKDDVHIVPSRPE